MRFLPSTYFGMTLFENKIWRANPHLDTYVNCINMPLKQVSVCDVEKYELLATIMDCIITPLPCPDNAIERAYLTLVLFNPSKKEERTMLFTSEYTIYKCEEENDFEYVCKFETPLSPTNDGKFGEREYFT